MKRFASFKAALSVIVCVSLIAVASARSNTQVEKTELLDRSQKQYYNLRSAGLVGFSCKVNVNWSRLLKDLSERGNEPEGVTLDMLQGLKFSMALGSNDQFTFERPAYPLIPDKETQDNVRMLLEDSEQMIGSFSSAWRPFVLTPIFPEATSVQNIIETDDGYRIQAKDGEMKTDLTMNKESVISNITVTSLLLTGTTRPTFTKTSRGLLLNKLDSNIGEGQIKSVITIEYQELEGLQLLKSVLYDSTDRGEKHIIELNFSDYSIKKK